MLLELEVVLKLELWNDDNDNLGCDKDASFLDTGSFANSQCNATNDSNDGNGGDVRNDDHLEMRALRGSKATATNERKDKCKKSSQRSCKRQQPTTEIAQNRPVKSNGDDKWECINGQFENSYSEFPFADFSGLKKASNSSRVYFGSFFTVFSIQHHWSYCEPNRHVLQAS